MERKINSSPRVEVSGKVVDSLRFCLSSMQGVFLALNEDTVSKVLVDGIQVARGAPSVSHLFFADNSLLFVKA